MKHVLVLGAQVPFMYGGAEILTESLVKEINKIDGIKAELINIPFKWYPETQILNDIMAWRLLDLSEVDGVKIDLVIATKFPSYALKHGNKVLWLVHQHRVIYDLEDTEFDTWSSQENSIVIKQKLKNLDNMFVDECKKTYTISETVSNRLKKYNNIESNVLYPPPSLSKEITPGSYKDYILYIGRLDSLKRVDLFVKALAKSEKGKGIIIGRGAEYTRLKELIKNNKLENKCELLGYVNNETLITYLSNARAIYYAPFNEDYGYATIEAFLAKKPVITCNDSGEVQKMVASTGSGIICDTNKKSIANAIDEIYSLPNSELEKMSQNGFNLAQKIQWEEIIQKLVLDNL